jgi:hypothetical protein
MDMEWESRETPLPHNSGSALSARFLIELYQG